MLEIRQVFALRGPNIWARFPVLEAWVDLKELKDSPSDALPGFNDRLMGWLPTMVEHHCGLGYRGGFFERLRTGTYQGHILEHVALELQELAGMPVGFGKARETSEEGVYRVIVQYREEAVGRAALEAAREMLHAAVHDLPFDVTAAVVRLNDLSYDTRLGNSSQAVADAARARGIPWWRLNDGNLVQYGQGVKQRRYVAAETDRTPAIAEQIASDKELTRTLLRAVGVPVPEGRPVSSPGDAWDAARSMGGPAVVKPRNANHGRGVALNLTTREAVEAAYEAATKEGDGVLVERFAPGSDHRLLVVAGKLAAAARREPPSVVGDGESTVAALVERANADPLRGDGFNTPLKTIPLNEAALTLLAEQGHSLDSVPPAGVRVRVGRRINFFDAGIAVDVTETVHPEVAARAVDAAHVVGLDVAGIDVVAEDLGRPLEEQGGVVVEVNAGPGLQMHLPPSASPRPVGETILEHMFPPGETGRIPIVGVTGVNGKTTTTRLIAHALRAAGVRVGMTCTDGIYFDGRALAVGDCSGPQSARDVLRNPRVEAAVLETARGGILRGGLAFDLCDVAVVTNIGEGDHLGLWEIDTAERLAYVKSTLIEAVMPGTGTAVLKADDPLVVPMAGQCRGSVLYFARDEAHPVMAEHRSGGGKTAFVRDGAIVLAEGDHEQVLAPLSRVPLTFGGGVGFQVENCLAASGAAWCLGLDLDVIRDALGTFTSDTAVTPGRFNVLDVDGATVILDFGHNPSAVAALVQAVEHLGKGHRTAVFSAEGDRPDDSIRRQAALLGDAFDRVILYEEGPRRRGRAPGAILALLREGLGGGTRVREVTDIDGELAAVEAGFDGLRPGDLVLIQVDAVTTDLAFVRRRLAAQAENRQATTGSVSV